MLEVSVLLFMLGLVCLWFVFARITHRLEDLETNLEIAIKKIEGYRG
jgi:hypothetical protein